MNGTYCKWFWIKASAKGPEWNLGPTPTSLYMIRPLCVPRTGSGVRWSWWGCRCWSGSATPCWPGTQRGAPPPNRAHTRDGTRPPARPHRTACRCRWLLQTTNKHKESGWHFYGLHLYCAFLTSGLSKRFTIMLNFHPLNHTQQPARREQWGWGVSLRDTSTLG